MENNQSPLNWSAVLEENIRNIFRSSLHNDSHNNGSSSNARTNPVGDTELIADLIYEYTHNMRDYNANIRAIIRLIENHQTRLSRPTPSAAPRRTRSDSLRNNLFMSFTSTIPMNTAGFQPQDDQHLTRQEIARSTFTYGFIPENNADASGNVCPISLEPFQEGDVICEIRGCRHKFKRPPLMNWLRRNSRCPVCRYELRNYTEPTVQTTPDIISETEYENITNEETEPGNDETPVLETSVNQDQQLSNVLTNMIQSLLQNQNVNTSDISGGLLYDFQFPLNR
jgi:hypothetical protein